MANGQSYQVERGVYAGQVDHILLRHNNKRVLPAEFKMQPIKFSFMAEMPLPADLCSDKDQRRGFKMNAMQLPMVSNIATTGHKLQGSTVINLFVHEWRYQNQLGLCRFVKSPGNEWTLLQRKAT